MNTEAIVPRRRRCKLKEGDHGKGDYAGRWPPLKRVNLASPRLASAGDDRNRASTPMLEPWGHEAVKRRRSYGFRLKPWMVSRNISTSAVCAIITTPFHVLMLVCLTKQQLGTVLFWKNCYHSTPLKWVCNLLKTLQFSSSRPFLVWSWLPTTTFSFSVWPPDLPRAMLTSSSSLCLWVREHRWIPFIFLQWTPLPARFAATPLRPARTASVFPFTSDLHT